MSSPNAKKKCSSTDPEARNVKDVLHDAAKRLKTAGIDSPDLAAQLLLGHLLGCGRAGLIARAEEMFPDDLADRYDSLLARRVAGEPIQHILGETEFWSLPISCDQRALIPRPETETLVSVALDLLEEIPSPRVADLGTGTGCVAIAIAREIPDAHVVAVDIDATALALAETNVTRHNLAHRIELLHGDMARPLIERGLLSAFDIIVSNPPYIPTAEISRLQAEVRDHDPKLALDGGPDGLDAIRRLIEETPMLLRAGWLAIEVGAGQAESVRGMLRAEGWSHDGVVKDQFGIERVVYAKRKS